MFLLVAGVEFRIVGFFVGKHFEDDLQQSLSEAAQRAGRAHALVSFFPIVGLAQALAFRKQLDQR